MTVIFSMLGMLLLTFMLGPLLYFCTTLSGEELRAVLSDPQTASALGVSLLTATVATAILASVGVPLGYLLARRQVPARRWVNSLVFLPLICPPPAAGILLLLVFGPNQGVGALLRPAGIQFLDNLPGIVLAQMFVAAPFVVVTSRAAFEAVPAVHEQISRTLGEGQWSTFWRVALPLARGGVLAGLLFAWLRSLGEFGATLVLAYHPYTLTVLMWVQLSVGGIRGALPVVLVALLVTVLALGLLSHFEDRPSLRSG